MNVSNAAVLNGTPKMAHQAAVAGQAEAVRGRWDLAHRHFVQAIRLEPDVANYHYAAALCDWAIGRMDSAGSYLQAAVQLNPNFGHAQAWLGEWYLNQGMIDAALQATSVAISLDPSNIAFMQSRAWVLEAAGDPDAAWELVLKVVAPTEMTPSLARLYGRLASRYGQQEQALEAIQRLLQAGIPHGEIALNFIAAQLLEAAEKYDEAFSLAAKANASYRGSPYNPQGQSRFTDQIIDYFTRQRLRAMPKTTIRSDKPVFIVGMPRSGTSLVEQILASHPAVHGAGELDYIHRTLVGMLDFLDSKIDDYPACLDNLTTEHVDGLTDFYLEPFIASAPDAARITDKMPLNFLHLGIISVLFPEARIIHCIRDPMDTCVSCYMTHFNQGNAYRYDLTHLGGFYRLYERLMTHWKSVIDLPVLDICYEQVIANPEAQSRKMVEFLSLPWDDRCLSFHKTKRACVTASALQVRRPIYGTSIGRWRHYEKHLGPLKAALFGGSENAHRHCKLVTAGSVERLGA
jgi:tetratricopeptide (TPR) repeat protein